MGGYVMGSQQQMGHFTGMIAADGSQAYFMPTVVVAMPSGGQMGHGAFAVPQMMSPAGSLDAIRQQMVQSSPSCPTNNGNVVVPACGSQVSGSDGQQWTHGQGWSTGEDGSMNLAKVAVEDLGEKICKTGGSGDDYGDCDDGDNDNDDSSRG